MAEKRRALILAGGGLKVAFQAGAMQVLLDEAGLDFPVADGTSGGTFNLAMYCQGMTGTRIADNWRTFRPASGIAMNLPGALLGPFGPGLFNFSKYVNGVFGQWGLDFATIRDSTVKASFNVYDFRANELVPLPPGDLEPQRLIACNSLAFWFPPVTIDGSPHLDAVYVTDANIEQALHEGANDIFVIWTISGRGRWRNGFWQQYFQAIEEVANGNFKRIQARIAANNDAIDNERCGEFGQRIELRVLAAEVPLNYIFNFRRDRMAAAVELGVQKARAFCDDQSIPRTPPPLPPANPTSPALKFKETMTGSVLMGPAPTTPTEPDNRVAHPVKLKATVHIGDINRFVTDPGHCASVSGTIESAAFGGTRELVAGRLNLLTFESDPGDARMHYVLKFNDANGVPCTLIGDKFVVDDPGSDMWSDTTTLHFNIWSGYLDPPDTASELLGAGVVEISPLGFLRQQLSMRAQVNGFPESQAAVIARFYAFFLGRLFDVYGQKILPWSPF